MMERELAPFDNQIENFEKFVKYLTEQWDAVNKQIRTEGDYEKRLLLQRRADDLWEEILQANDKKDKLYPEKVYNKKNLFFQEKLLYIDFSKAMNSIEKRFQKFCSDLGESIFFIENSHPMAGEHCIYRIRERLDNKTGTFRHFSIGITPSRNPSELCILAPLAQYLNANCESKDDVIEYTTKVINKICESLQTGSVVFIEITNWNYFLECQDKILPWFLNGFWNILIEEARITIQRNDLRQVKVVAVINAKCKMKLEKHKHLLSQHNVVKILLKNWTQEDIKNWLGEYSSGIANSSLTGYEIDRIAEQIFLQTEKGKPLMVCEALKEELLRYN